MPGARVRLLAAWLAYYRRQRLAGKLNLLFLSLFVVLLLNVLAVFVSLSIVYASNAALWKLERFESRVGAIERTLLRFRISHERGDALVVRDLLASADELLAGIPGRVFETTDTEGDDEVQGHMRGFSQRLNEYLYFHEQVMALESGMRKASDELQTSVLDLRAERMPERLAPTVARLYEAALQARLAQQEYVLSRDGQWVLRLREHLETIAQVSSALRHQSPSVETQIVAYSIGQEVQVLKAAFERFAELLTTIGDWQLHRFRHTSATMWLRAGVKLELVSRYLGHARIQQTLAYAELIRDDIQVAVERNESRFARLIGETDETAA